MPSRAEPLTRLPSMAVACRKLTEPAARLDDDLVTAVTAQFLGVGDEDLLLVEVDQHALVLQAVEPEDAVGRAEVAACDDRRRLFFEVEIGNAVPDEAVAARQVIRRDA